MAGERDVLAEQTMTEFWDTHCSDCAHDRHSLSYCSAIVGGDMSGPEYCPCSVEMQYMVAEIANLRAALAAAPSPEPLPREALDVERLRRAVMRSLEQDDRDPHGDYRETAASIAREYAALPDRPTPP